MAESIMQEEKVCFLCGGYNNLECHHIFFGTANRKHSEEDGMKVWLCGERCHRNGKNAVHKNRTVDLKLKMMAQEKWEATYGNRNAFRIRYGKSYL